MEITRRQLLQRTRDLALASYLGPLIPGIGRPSFGASKPDGFFLMIETFGGMDVTLGLDPWVLPAGADEKDLFLEYRPEDIKEASGLKLGPAAVPLAPHAGDCVVVNGVMMRRDAGHDVILAYMATGRGDGKAASLPVELALATGTGPFGIVISNNTYLAGKAASLSSTYDILNDTNRDGLLNQLEERLKVFPPTKGSPFERAQQDLIAGRVESQKLYAMLNELAKKGPVAAPHVIAASFASGGAYQAQISYPSGNLDTHINHEGNHLTEQKKIWQGVADIFALFKSIPYKSGSLFDATTFMVISEWARTPALNAAKGKDHNPFTNSVLLAGRGLRKGSVVGASRLIPRSKTVHGMPEHIAWPFDYQTGKLAQTTKGAGFIFPENIIKTVGQLFGAPSTMSAIAPEVSIVPGVLS